ncbi:uncharacterized protein [Spinacia oleracea]|uniref:Reverse transcriptase domain-containing protein n=1 Tax=Spinacia oleracea TaxID=3562 RepID=A0ABM3RSE3_SPIOL|nr:uncharacterized protein LOC110803092 [Spinacia oleracea]
MLDSIPVTKAPGLDGFNSQFFKSAWPIIKDEFCLAIKDFFTTGKLLKEINVTSISLVPKLHVPASGAFVAGRSILHSVLLCQDIIKLYNRGMAKPAWFMKLDLRKAYDTVEWSFIEEIMVELGFPAHFIQLVMTCLSTTQYSILINGVPPPIIHPKRGLRCRSISLNHLVFADELLLFCNGDTTSVKLLLEGLNLFSTTTRLQVNPGKSSIYSCGLDQHTKEEIASFSDFNFGKLPFKYLGVPISTGKIKAGDCSLLVEKMVAKTKVWSSRYLSFAGRMHLINSVLMSISVYWGQAAVGKLAWAIEQKQDNLWVKWMHTVYIKNKNWLQYQAPQAASWAVKCICKAKQACCDTLGSSSWLTKRKFSIKEVYNLLKNQTGKTQWARYVWNRLTIPKYRFTLWVLLLERLKTRDRLFQYGVCADNLCPLCGNYVEICAHLFFDCVYSRKFLADLMAWLGLSTHRTSVVLIM